MIPGCPINAPRFRITASSNMTKEQMDNIVRGFVEAREAHAENPELKEFFQAI